jgi:hypothetical protein
MVRVVPPDCDVFGMATASRPVARIRTTAGRPVLPSFPRVGPTTGA